MAARCAACLARRERARLLARRQRGCVRDRPDQSRSRRTTTPSSSYSRPPPLAAAWRSARSTSLTARRCAARLRRAAVRQDACVYCADGARQCVPGTAFGGPVGMCGNWFSRSCPDFVLSIDGAPQRASILAGNTHTYSFVVPSGTKEDVRVDVLSYPREVQMNSEVSLLMRRGQAPAITGSNNGVPVGMWDFANLTDKVPRGDFSCSSASLGEGTYYVTVLSQRPYSYDIRLNLACGCASSSGGQTPRITALTPSIGALVSPADTVRSVDIAGSDFSNALQPPVVQASRAAAVAFRSTRWRQLSGGKACSARCRRLTRRPTKTPARRRRTAAVSRCRTTAATGRTSWSYRQYLNVVLGDQRTRAAAPPRSGVPTRLAVGQADYYRLDTSELGVAAVSFFARQLEPGALALYVMPQDARDAALACGWLGALRRARQRLAGERVPALRLRARSGRVVLCGQEQWHWARRLSRGQRVRLRRHDCRSARQVGRADSPATCSATTC
jgi:hypothetical protein